MSNLINKRDSPGMRLYDKVEKAVGNIAKLFAILGGLMLLALTLMTVISVIGRGLIFVGLGPIPGDFELVEIGIAFAVAACLPWCQFVKGHAVVDLFEGRFGAWGNYILNLTAAILMFVISIFIAWRLWAGLQDKLASFFPEVTQILGIPIWWAYVATFSGLAIFVLVSGFSIVQAIRETP